jgi:hypothetical protein
MHSYAQQIAPTYMSLTKQIGSERVEVKRGQSGKTCQNICYELVVKENIS